MTTKPLANQRLESLDVLRGFDLFFLVGLEVVMHTLSRTVDTPWFKSIMWDSTMWIGKGFLHGT